MSILSIKPVIINPQRPPTAPAAVQVRTGASGAPLAKKKAGQSASPEFLAMIHSEALASTKRPVQARMINDITKTFKKMELFFQQVNTTIKETNSQLNKIRTNIRKVKETLENAPPSLPAGKFHTSPPLILPDRLQDKIPAFSKAVQARLQSMNDRLDVVNARIVSLVDVCSIRALPPDPTRIVITRIVAREIYKCSLVYAVQIRKKEGSPDGLSEDRLKEVLHAVSQVQYLYNPLVFQPLEEGDETEELDYEEALEVAETHLNAVCSQHQVNVAPLDMELSEDGRLSDVQKKFGLPTE